MSLSAIAWVFEQDIRPSSIKFVLLALADSAGGGNDDSIAWPSVPAISQKTSQDRKTVIDALSTLEKMRLLEDTGRRTGTTKQIKVYRIVGLPSGIYHYTYRLKDEVTGEYYLGVRSCNGDPTEDSYMGSGRWPQGKNGLVKTILAQHTSRPEAEAHEVQLIRDNFGKPLCMNVWKPSRIRDCSVSPAKQSRISSERVPETGHGTVMEPLMEPSTVLHLESGTGKKKKSKAGTVNGSKPAGEVIEAFCVSIDLPKSDGEIMLMKWNADGWPKNWMDKIRYWKRMGFMPSQKGPRYGTPQAGARRVDGCAVPAGWDKWLTDHPEYLSKVAGRPYAACPEYMRREYDQDRKKAKA